jgi:hypothetical protein
MAIIIKNPTNIPEAVSTGYRQQNIVIYASMVGFCNINMTGFGIISAGSVVEINGSLVKSYKAEEVLGINSIPNSSLFFVYIVPDNETDSYYEARIDVPEWDTVKSGYYSTDGSRAVIRAYRDENGNIGGITKMADILSTDIPPNSGGVLIYTKNVRSFEHLYLEPGYYRYEMASGLGQGNGGNGEVGKTGGSASAGGAWGVPTVAIVKSAVFWSPGCSVAIRVGGSGLPGLEGGDGAGNTYGSGGGGGGSGCGAGEETSISFLSTKFTTGKSESGKGGDGGTAMRGSGGLGAFGGGSGQDGIDTAGAGFEGKGGVGYGLNFTNPGYEDYGGAGGGVGAGNAQGGDGGSINIWEEGRAFSTRYPGAPGWLRPMGNIVAGYCRIYSLTA